MRVIWMFTGNKYAHWDKFISIHRARRRGFVPTVFFYMFLRDKPPGYDGHNPVAASAYVLGLRALFPRGRDRPRAAGRERPTSVLVHGSGLAWLFGGLAMARWIHHIVMWLLLGFTVHHVYSAALVAMIEKNGTIDSIISGYKWVPRSDLMPGPYRWNNRGEIDE